MVNDLTLKIHCYAIKIQCIKELNETSKWSKGLNHLRYHVELLKFHMITQVVKNEDIFDKIEECFLLTTTIKKQNYKKEKTID